MEIASGIYAYRGRPGTKIRRGAGSSNVAVVKGDGLAMVDTGLVAGGAFEELKAGIEKDGLDVSSVDWILHTHGHGDHFYADKAVLTHATAKIAAGESDAAWIENSEKSYRDFFATSSVFKGEVLPYPRVVLRLMVQYIFGTHPKLKVDRTLVDEDVVDIGRRIETISLPGHTNGHMGFFVPDAGVLILGDLIDFENAQGMDLNNLHSNYESALKSLERAIELEPEIIVPGHGEPTINQKRVRDVLEKALAGGVEYPKMIKKALGTTAVRLKKLTHTVFPDTPFTMEMLNMMLVLTVLLYMEKQGSATRVADRNGRPAWIG